MTADEIPAFDLYAELEVSERASTETIQAAYRSLQLRNHPDRAGEATSGRAVRLNIARDWLTDPARRARYDAALAVQRRAAVDGGATRGTDDAPHPGTARRASDTPTADDIRSSAELVTDPRPTLAHWLRRRLRIDIGRLGRIWIAGLGLLGAIALVPEAVGEPGVRIAIAAIVAAALAWTATGVARAPADGLPGRIVGRAWMLLGWAALAALAVAGVRSLAALADGGRPAVGVSEAAAPVLAVTALLSVLAIRRRQGPHGLTIDEFLDMTPSQFEGAVGGILARHGYRLQLTGGPGDLVADLVGTDPEGRPTIVQCKRYAPGHPVGSREVQLLIAMGVRHHRAEHLVLATTSDFTDPAWDLADEHGVTLISGEELEDLTR